MHVEKTLETVLDSCISRNEQYSVLAVSNLLAFLTKSLGRKFKSEFKYEVMPVVQQEKDRLKDKYTDYVTMKVEEGTRR